MMCKQSEKLLHETFPHLINEVNVKPEFLEVLLTESRLDTELEPPLIKEEIFECPDFMIDEINEEMHEDSNQASDSSEEEFKPKINLLEKSEPKEKSLVKRKYGKRLYPCHVCGKTYDKFRLESHLNAHNSKTSTTFDVRQNLM